MAFRDDRRAHARDSLLYGAGMCGYTPCVGEYDSFSDGDPALRIDGERLIVEAEHEGRDTGRLTLSTGLGPEELFLNATLDCESGAVALSGADERYTGHFGP